MKVTWWLLCIFSFGALAMWVLSTVTWYVAFPKTLFVTTDASEIPWLLIDNILGLIQWIMIAGAIVCLLAQLRLLAKKTGDKQAR